jgi:hypothetical protein
MIKLKDPLTLVASRVSIANISSDEWAILDDLVKLLNSLEDATRQICGEEYPSASLTIPIIRIAMDEIVAQSLSSSEVILFQSSLIETLRERFDSNEDDPVLSICTLLDPRFKSSGFTNATKLKKAERLVESMVESIVISSNSSISTSVGENINNKPIMTKLAANMAKKHMETNNSNQSELNLYKGQPLLDIGEDVLVYWDERKCVFPKLYIIARRYLIIPSTSAASERIFSLAGNIISSKRTKLSASHINMLIFLNKNNK